MLPEAVATRKSVPRYTVMMEYDQKVAAVLKLREAGAVQITVGDVAAVFSEPFMEHYDNLDSDFRQAPEDDEQSEEEYEADQYWSS